jgi:hypothetical protein
MLAVVASVAPFGVMAQTAQQVSHVPGWFNLTIDECPALRAMKLDDIREQFARNTPTPEDRLCYAVSALYLQNKGEPEDVRLLISALGVRIPDESDPQSRTRDRVLVWPLDYFPAAKALSSMTDPPMWELFDAASSDALGEQARINAVAALGEIYGRASHSICEGDVYGVWKTYEGQQLRGDALKGYVADIFRNCAESDSEVRLHQLPSADRQLSLKLDINLDKTLAKSTVALRLENTSRERLTFTGAVWGKAGGYLVIYRDGTLLPRPGVVVSYRYRKTPSSAYSELPLGVGHGGAMGIGDGSVPSIEEQVKGADSLNSGQERTMECSLDYFLAKAVPGRYEFRAEYQSAPYTQGQIEELDHLRVSYPRGNYWSEWVSIDIPPPIKR